MSQMSAGHIGNCRFSIKIARLDELGVVIPESVRDAGIHCNLVLNQGLFNLLTGGISNIFHLGTGTSAPDRTATTLASPIGGAQGVFAMNSGAGVSTSGTDAGGRYSEWSGAGQSPVFTVDRNISEIGFGWGTANNQIMSRALTRNNSGVPTAIPVLSGEVLIPTYFFRVYEPVGVLSGEMTVTTDGTPVVHSWTSQTRTDQVLNVGQPTGLNITNLVTSLSMGGAVRTFTAGTVSPTADGARVFCSYTKAANTGLINITSLLSAPTVQRTIPVDIRFTPAIVITNDQRATWSFYQYLTQDYS